MESKLFAIAATVGLVLVALGPGVATVAADTVGNDSLDVSVQQPDGSAPTVSVTQNETGVADAAVNVSVTDNGTYDGTGNYTADANGTVSLPAPEENVSVAVDASANNQTASTTATLTAVNDTRLNDSFGLSVSSFVHSLLQNDTENVGQQVAAFAVGNNPGNAPDHAGPPAHVTGDNETDRGPPADAGPDGERGPPADAGPNADDGNETADNETDRGPPADAGPDGERGPNADDDNETDGGPAGSGPPSDGDDTRGPPENRGN